MREEFETARALRHISKLSSNGRLYGTPGEMLARSYIIASGGESGVQFEEEEVRFSHNLCRNFMPAVLVILAILSIGGSVSYFYNSYYAALILGITLLAVLGTFPVGFKIINRLSSKRGRDTVVNLAGRVGSERSLGTIVICAHYDSKSNAIPLALRLFMLLAGLISAAVLGAVFILSGIFFHAGRDAPGGITVLIAGIAVAAVFRIIVFDRPGNRSPGALDNASGVAVVLELARIVEAKPLRNLDVVAVAFGAEEVGLCGSAGYVRAHKDELKEKLCFVINFDMPFSHKGKISVNTGFGLPHKRTSRKLNDYAKAVAAGLGYKLDTEYLLGGSSDHYHWVKEGFEATSFTSSAGYIHSTRDTVERINRDALGRAGGIALGVIRRLDEDLSG